MRTGIIITVLLLTFSACIKNGPGAISPELTAYDELILKKPDSVLTVLKPGIREIFNPAKQSWTQDELFHLYLYSKALFLTGSIDSAHNYTLLGLSLAQNENVPWVTGKLMGQAGYKHTVTAQFDSAAWYFSRAKQQFAAVGDSTEFYKSVVNWAMSESKVHHRSSPTRWAMRAAVNYYTKINMPVNIALSATNLASHYSDENMRDSARYYLQCARNNIEFVPIVQQPQIWLNSGISAEEDSLYHEALQYYEKAEQLNNRSERIRYAVACNKAIVLNKLGKSDTSLLLLNQLLPNIPEVEDFRDLRQLAWREQAAILQDKEKWRESLIAYKRSAELSDSLMGWNTQAKLSDIRAQYEQSERNRVVLQKESEAKYRNLILVALVLLLLLIGYALKKRNKLLVTEQINAKMLSEKNKELLDINKQLVIDRDASTGGDTDLNHKMLTLNNRENTQIQIGDILYIRAGEGGVYYHIKDGSQVFNWQSLRSCTDLLPPDEFIQISKSHVVCKSEIIGKTASLVRLRGGEALDLGAAYREHL